MNRLNIKLLVILAVTFVVLTTGVVVVHAIQMNRNIESLIKRAEAARKNEDPRTAIRLYSRYHSYRPDDLDRYADFANFLADQALTAGGSSDYFTARRALQDVMLGLESDRDNEASKQKLVEMRRKQIDLNFHYREFKAAAEDLQRLKDKGQSDAKADMQLAQCYIQMGQYREAVKLLQSLVGYDSEARTFNVAKAAAPNELDAYALLAVLLRDKLQDVDMPGRVELADRVIDQLVTVNKDSAKAFLMKAQYLSDYKARDAAIDSLADARRLAPEDAEVLLRSAEVDLQAKNYPAAELWIEKGVKKYSDDARFYRIWVILADLQGKPDQAKERMAAGLQALPTNILLLDIYFQRQIQERDFEGARTTLKKLAIARLRPEILEYYECRILMGEGNNAEAAHRLEQLRPRLAKFNQLIRPVDVMLVQCYLALNQPDRTLEVAERVKDTLEGKMGLAYAYASTGQGEKALQIYTWIADALEQSDKIKDVPQLASAILQLQISVQMGKPAPDRKWNVVDNLLTKMRTEGLLKEPAASLIDVTVLTCKGENEKARQLVNDLARQYPNDLSVVSRAVTMALQGRKPDDAIQIIDAAPPALRNDPLMLAGRIEAHLISKAAPDEQKLALTVIKRDAEKLPQDKRARVYASLGMAHLRLGDAQAAREYWSQAAEWQPRDAAIRQLMFNLARATGDLASMKGILDWFEKESAGDQAQFKQLHAALLVSTVQQSHRTRQTTSPQQITLDETDKQNLRTARNLLSDVKELRPGWVEQPKLMAEIDVIEGRPDDAIARLKEVIARGQPTGEVVKNLAQLLISRGRIEEAGDLLEKYAVLVAGDREVEKIQAVIYQRRGQPEKSLGLMKKNFSKDSLNPTDHLIYGEILATAKQWKEAEEEFRRAVELAPEMAEAWLDLVKLFMANKQPDRALEAIQEAQIKLPEDRRSLALAQGYEMLGDRGQAEQYYLSSLSTAPKNLVLLQQVAAFYVRANRIEQAKKYLNEIMRATPTQPIEKDCFAWARRMTAQLLAMQGTYGDFQRAMELLSPPGEPTTAEDLLTRVSLLFERNDPMSTKQASRCLEELSRMRPLTSPERLMLAQVYERLDNWPRANEEMLSLLTQPTKPDANVYLTFIEMLLRRGFASDAQDWGRNMKSAGVKIAPELEYYLAARILAAQGQGPNAAAYLLNNLLPAERPVPKDKWPMLRQVAGYLEQIGQYEQAEKILREYLSYEPGQVFLLADFLARRGRIDATLDLAEQNRNEITLLQRLHVGSKALRHSAQAPKPEQFSRVEQWFERAQREEPDSLEVKLELCDFRELQRRYDDLEKLYREILRRSDLPSKVRAGVMNNIAFLLAVGNRDPDEAMRLINEAINLFGPDSDLLDTRGVVYLSKKEVQKAVADLSDAVMVTDPKPIKYVHLALAQEAANDYPSARDSLKTAKELKFDVSDLSSLEKPAVDAMLKRLNVSLEKP